MAVYAVGDSIADGLNNTPSVTKTAGLSHGGYAIKQMGGFFEKVTALVKPGDTVIVSAGYNYSAGLIPQPEVLAITNDIKRLKEKGADVRILGLREENITAAYANKFQGTTPQRNNQLREIAKQSGATFAEASIAVANSIPNGEIHGNYALLAQAAIKTSPLDGAAIAGAAAGEKAAAASTPSSDATSEDSAPATNGDQTSALESAKNKVSSWWDGAKEACSNLGFSGIAGGLIGGLIALCIGNAFGGGGWFGTILAVCMAPILVMLGVRLGKSTGDIVSTSMGGNTPEIAGQQIERSGPQLQQALAMESPEDKRAFDQGFADALQQQQQRQRYAFANVSSSQYGADYSLTPAPYYGPRPEQPRTPGWTYRS